MNDGSPIPDVSPDDSLLKGLEVIERDGSEIALVVENGILLGIITDGDARRAILGGKALDCPVRDLMQRNFHAVSPSISRAEVLDLMRALRVKQVPIVGPNNELLGLHQIHDLLGVADRQSHAIIFCGGLGSRLRPLTNNFPKPMLPVAGRPILERLVLHLVGHGVRNIHLAIHFMGEIIERHFDDGRNFGCTISYIREEKPLGTGGALAFLPQGLTHPVLALNGDLVTQFDVGRMLEAHAEHGNRITVGTRSYVHEVPFGVITVDNGQVTGMAEKPSLRQDVNAGIYVLDPVVCGRVPAGVPVTIPELIQDCLLRQEKVGHLPVDEEWMDVGRPADLQRARGLE